MESISNNRKNGNEIKTFLLIIALIIIVVGVFYILNSRTEISHAQKQLNHLSNCTHSHEKDEFIELNFETNREMTGLIAPDILYSELNKDDKRLSDIAKKRHILIYRFSDRNCSTCFQEELKSLLRILPENCDFVKVLCSYQSPRDLQIFKNDNAINLPAYLIPYNAFDWLVEEKNKPYYFVLHPDMKISHIYVPDVRYPELNKQYIEGVMRLLAE